MGLDQRLLDELACPHDRGPLYVLDAALYNPRLRLKYRVDDGIPVMLPDEAEHLDEAAHQLLIAEIERNGSPQTLRG